MENVPGCVLVFVLLICSSEGIQDPSNGLFNLAANLDGRKNTDVVFVVDTSAGMNRTDFLKLKSLAIKGISCFGFPKTNRMALVKFSRRPKTLLNFNSCSNKECYVKNVNRVRYAKSSQFRAIGVALRYARTILKTTARMGVTKSVALLVGGDSNIGRNPMTVARRLKNAKTEIFVLAFGSIPPKSLANLKQLATSDKYFTHFTKPEEQISMAELLMDIMCTSGGSKDSPFKMAPLFNKDGVE